MGAVLRSRSALMAENLFLRKQLVLYLERKVKPRRANDATRLTLVQNPALVILGGLHHKYRLERVAA